VTKIRVSSRELTPEHIGKFIEAIILHPRNGRQSNSVIYGRIEGVSHDADDQSGVVTTVSIRLDDTQIYKASFRGVEVNVADSTAEHLQYSTDPSIKGLQ
jgi:hypothetical protein